MKQLILVFGILSFLTTSAQYSNYYSVDLNQNVHENIKVSGNVNVRKNITTIDYGQLAIANAQRERNRLENLKYMDEREKNISIEIASDPMKAFDYGYQSATTISGKHAKLYGFKKFVFGCRVPHNSLFVSSGAGRFENVSSDGITTEIIFYLPLYNEKNVELYKEKLSSNDSIKVGELNTNTGAEINGESFFVLKKDLNRATVFGFKGFKSTIILEDNFQYLISDSYFSLDESKGSGIRFDVKVRTFGDKDEVTFEQLEGRRYYLKRLLEKVISTAVVGDIKF
jgi:hypothetical protein